MGRIRECDCHGRGGTLLFSAMAESQPLKEVLARQAARVDAALDGWLPRASTRPRILHKAMRHSVFAGGKRLRPILCLSACEACGADPDEALPSACAVECVHTYSLVHDDLPCMDDDDFRRGRPTSHKMFGEAVAVLAGDALQCLAFEILGTIRPPTRYAHGDFVSELATAAGSRQLVGGQVADIEAEGSDSATPAAVRFIHRNKTAALLRASTRLGAMHANATPARLRALTQFADSLGLAFQIIDDILDCTQSSEKLGKSAGKDAANGKATFPAVFGMKKSRAEAARLTRKAARALDPLGRRATHLRQIAEHLLARDY